MKTNTISMAVSKTYCLFYFQTEICLFFHIFSYGQYLAPEKKCNLPVNIFRTFPMELKYTENIKEIINVIYYRFS